MLPYISILPSRPSSTRPPKATLAQARLAGPARCNQGAAANSRRHSSLAKAAAEAPSAKAGRNKLLTCQTASKAPMGRWSLVEICAKSKIVT